MSTRTSIATVVILTARLLTGDVRADCLTGHLGNFQISARLYALGRNVGCVRDERFTNAAGHVECDTYCDCSDITIPCIRCVGSAADFNVTTSANGYTITTHAQAQPGWSVGDDLQASARASVQATVLDGLVRCTIDGVNKRVIEGVETSWPMHREVTGTPGTLLNFGYELWESQCWAVGSGTGGEVTCTLTVSCTPAVSSGIRSWINPNGGSYQTASNWSTDCVPVHDAQRSDIASFALSSASFIPVSGAGATAGQWLVSNTPIEFSGSAQVFSTSATAPSLHILQGGQLRLASGASLDSVYTSVGLSGATDSKLEVKGGSWTNSAAAKIGRGSVDVLDGGTASTGALTIGSGNGPGSVQVTGEVSTFDVTGEFVVGDTTAGTLEIDEGFFSNTSLSTPPVIGKSATGTVTVRGDDSNLNSHGRLQTNHTLIVGDGASGRLNVQRGGHVSVAQDLVVSGYGANPAGEVVVDAQGGVNMLDVSGGTFINASELQEVLVQNGGRFSTNDLFIGNRQIRPGTADVTVRARSGSFPTLTVGTPGGGGAGTFVGDTVPGQLNVEFGALAELNNGLHVGEAAQGIVSVSRRELPPGTYAARLEVTGETQVGIGAPGIVQLDEEASMETNGDLLIGLGPGSPSGSVNVNSGSRIDVNGALAVGVSGVGVMNIVDEPSSFPSHVFCDTLVVGGNTPTATGIIVLSFVPNVPVSPHFSHLTVNGSTQVGVGPGRGEILLADASGRLEINGTMTIGNPAGGPGGSAVTLVDATIDGTGKIVVNPNGSLIGTGTVAVPKVDAGGHIAIARSGAPSPNATADTTVNAEGRISAPVSPGTLTIDGDYEQLPTGVLVIDYAGLNPGEFDVLHVTGQTTLGGKLEVHFRNGFSPADPAAFIQSQDFVEADGVITGDYEQRIYAFPDRFADFDDDGDKDFSDVAAFQNCFGLSGAELLPACERADWDNDGVIGGREIEELGVRLTGP